MDTLVKTARLDALSVRSVGEFAHFRGRLIVWDVRDERGDAFERGSFDLGAQDAPPLLWGDSGDDVIGLVPRVSEDAIGLTVDGKIVLATKRGREAVALIKQRAVKHLGAVIAIPPGGAVRDGTGLRITRAELRAVSLSVFSQQQGAELMQMRGRTRIETVDLDELAEWRAQNAKLRQLAEKR